MAEVRSTTMALSMIRVWTYKIGTIGDGTYYSTNPVQQVNLELAVSK